MQTLQKMVWHVQSAHRTPMTPEELGMSFNTGLRRIITFPCRSTSSSCAPAVHRQVCLSSKRVGAHQLTPAHSIQQGTVK